MRIFLPGLLAMSTALPAFAKVKLEDVTYRHGDTTLEGVFAHDDAVAGKRPAVIVVHEWMGPGPYTRRRAEQLAAMGYVAFAADIYGKGVRPKNHEEAGKTSGMFRADRALVRGRMAAALERVRSHPRVDPTRVAAIGYCFGGMSVLELARSGADLRAVASFHGALDTPTPATKGAIKAKVVAFHGGDDGFIPAAAVAGFQDEMRAAGADWQLVLFGGAVHSFTVAEAGNDPSKGMAYNESADRRSWKMLESLLGESFK